MANLAQLLQTMIERGASDLHITSGTPPQIRVNGDRPKPAKLVALADELRIRKGSVEFHVVVRALAEQRGPATVARTLYEETSESRGARARQAARRNARPTPVYDGKGRPTKRDRRQLDRWHDETPF